MNITYYFRIVLILDDGVFKNYTTSNYHTLAVDIKYSPVTSKTVGISFVNILLKIKNKKPGTPPAEHFPHFVIRVN